MVDAAELSPLHLSMIEAAAAAPSPDNNQPWLFDVDGDNLRVFLDPAQSLPSDESSMFDMTAIGAAAENAVIAAAQQGKLAVPRWVGWNMDSARETPVAVIEISGDAEPDPLYASLEMRCTCRKPYASDPLPEDLQHQLARSMSDFPNVQLDWISDRHAKSQFGKIIARTDGLRFRHRPFHEELFRQLRFSVAEAEQTRDGLDVRTLELPPGVATVLRALRSWSLMQWIHRCRLTGLLTAPSAGAVRRSGAIALFSVTKATPEAFFEGGRAIQRFWLAAAGLELSTHPLGSLPIFLLQADPTPSSRPIIDQARGDLAKLLPNLDNRVLQMALRVGRSNPPTMRSLRRPVQAMMRR